MLDRKGLRLDLLWTPREENALADALTNEDFSKFNPEHRIHLTSKDIDLRWVERALEAERQQSTEPARDCPEQPRRHGLEGPIPRRGRGAENRPDRTAIKGAGRKTGYTWAKP
eukprot:5988799-Amphidinium_carterae.1